MAYPKSQDKKIQKLTNVLVKYAESEGIEFSFGGELLYPVEAFSYWGCLSLFLAETKETYEKLYNNLYTTQELMEGIGKKIKNPSMEQMIMEQELIDKQPKNKIFPIEFHEQDETIFNFVPRISQEIPCEFHILVHFSHYTLEEYLKIYKKNKMLLIEGRVPLDPLYDKMVTKINAQQIQLIAAPVVPKAVNTSGQEN